MEQKASFLHDRNLWIYYALFFSGASVLIYQTLSLSIVGDSVNFLCLLFLINSLHVRRSLHVLENSLLMTLGYILPLLIRNSLKLSYAEAPSLWDFVRLGAVSSLTTLALGMVFTTLGLILKHFAKKAWSFRRSRITTDLTRD